MAPKKSGVSNLVIIRLLLHSELVTELSAVIYWTANIIGIRYWIPKEGTKDMLNDGTIVSLTGPKRYPLKTSSGKLIAKVCKTAYEVCQ